MKKPQSSIRSRLRSAWDKKQMWIEIDNAFKKSLDNPHFKKWLELSMAPSPLHKAIMAAAEESD